MEAAVCWSAAGRPSLLRTNGRIAFQSPLIDASFLRCAQPLICRSAVNASIRVVKSCDHTSNTGRRECV
jgi:hypothetical protein